LERFNEHPADRLSAIRIMIKELEQEEEAVRDWLLTHRDDLRGFDFEATVSNRSYRRIDPEALRRHVPAETVAKCIRTTTVDYVHLKALRERELAR
jgi:hypothetical protein